MSFDKLTVFFRGIAFVIDTVIAIIPSMLIQELFMGELFIGELLLSQKIMLILPGIFLVMLRDIFGKSLGKYLMGLDILDEKRNTKAKWYQRLLKNITAPLSVIEILLVLMRKDHRRIGDMLAKTETRLNENSYALSLFQQFLR